MKLRTILPFPPPLLTLTFVYFPLCFANPSYLVPTVVAPFGTIEGQVSTLEPTVHEYLGIPFALPPIGARRFAPPERIPNRARDSKPLVAIKYGLTCPGVIPDFGDNYPYQMGGGVGGEDCLSLNIWTKPGRSNAPVLVWIYGGGFLFGATDTSLYNGANFVANNEVVLVSINYRTNVFGFPNAPNLKNQNLGILDQRVALEWIRDNIEAFGGDSDKITLFGQSAGGASADFHSYAWPKDPIAHALIAQSGSVGLLPSLGGESGDDYYQWGNLTQKVGCYAEGNQKEQLKCMREVPWKSLIEGVHALQTCENPYFVGFVPRVDEKVVFSPAEYQRRRKLGLFAKLPLLIGNTNGELAEIPPGPLAEGCPPPAPFPDGWSWEVIGKIMTAVDFSCPAGAAANSRFLHGVPVWRYRYFGSFNSGLGGAHLAEVPALFGTAWNSPELSERDRTFTRYLQSLWVAFATTPSTGLSSPPYNLPQYNPAEATLIRLDYDGQLAGSTTHPGTYDFICNIMHVE